MAKDGKDIHKGHRKRVRVEFLKNGFNEDTPPHKIVEMILFFSIPRKDTNEVAHRLLERFGSLSGIIDAPFEYLEKVEGVGPHTAALFKLFMPVSRAYLTDKAKISRLPDLDASKNQLCRYLQVKCLGLTKETFTVASFNAQNKMTGCDTIDEGSETEVNVSVRNIVENALLHHAVTVVIAHNHPDGFALPSPSDIDMTRRIKAALDNIGIRLADHIIVTADDYVSMADSRSLAELFE